MDSMGLGAQTSCTSGSLVTTNVVSRQANTDVQHGHLYQLWDADKIQICKCDMGYTGPDCASRVPPKGDDPLSTMKANLQQQLITIGPGTGSPDFAGQQFFMV